MKLLNPQEVTNRIEVLPRGYSNIVDLFVKITENGTQKEEVIIPTDICYYNGVLGMDCEFTYLTEGFHYSIEIFQSSYDYVFNEESQVWCDNEEVSVEPSINVIHKDTGFATSSSSEEYSINNNEFTEDTETDNEEFIIYDK